MRECGPFSCFGFRGFGPLVPCLFSAGCGVRVAVIPDRRVASFGLDGRCAVAPCRLDVSTDL